MHDPDEYPELRETAFRYAREKLLPRYQAREQESVLDRGMMREMGALGFIGPELPEEYGGLGLTNVASGVRAVLWLVAGPGDRAEREQSGGQRMGAADRARREAAGYRLNGAIRRVGRRTAPPEGGAS